MLKQLSILALMATIAIGAPLEATKQGRGIIPSFRGGKSSTGSVTGLLYGAMGGVGKTKVSASMSLSAGFNWSVAKGMEACVGGVASGSCGANDKAALLAWIKGAGAAYFDPLTCWEIEQWCGGAEGFVMAAWAQTSMEAYMAIQQWATAAGGMWGFFNGVISSGAGASGCACSAMTSGDMLSLSSWISSSSSGLDIGIKGSLSLCAAGGFAESLSSAARGSISAWLSSPSCGLEVGLKSSVSSWLLGGKAQVGLSIGGPSGASGTGVEFTSSGKSLLSSFMAGSSFTGLPTELQGCMQAAFTGGIASSVSKSSISLFSQWLLSSASTFDADLKSYAQSWIAGETCPGTQKVGAMSATASGYAAVAGKIAGNILSSGALTEAAQQTLGAFISGSAGASMDASYKVSLEACAAGGLASSLEAAASSTLALWLASSSCSLEAEMRGTVLTWMSFGKGEYTLSGDLAVEVKGKFSAAGDDAMSAGCKGSFGIAIAGEASSGASIGGAAEISAFLCGGGAVSWGGKAELAMFGWISGEDCPGSV